MIHTDFKKKTRILLYTKLFMFLFNWLHEILQGDDKILVIVIDHLRVKKRMQKVSKHFKIENLSQVF